MGIITNKNEKRTTTQQLVLLLQFTKEG